MSSVGTMGHLTTKNDLPKGPYVEKYKLCVQNFYLQSVLTLTGPLDSFA